MRRAVEQTRGATREVPPWGRRRRPGGAPRAIQVKQQSMHPKVPFLFLFSVGHPAPSAAGDLKKLLPAGDAEIPDRVEPISLEGQADLFDRQVRLRIEVDDLADTDFRRGQHRIRGHEPNAAGDPVELHERIGLFQRVAKCLHR